MGCVCEGDEGKSWFGLNRDEQSKKRTAKKWRRNVVVAITAVELLNVMD